MSTVAKKIIMGSGAVAGAYEIDQSITLNAVSDPNIYREVATTGNRKTFTYSCWVKFSSVTAGWIVGCGDAGDNTKATLELQADATLRVNIWNSGVAGKLDTNAVFRDPAAWYHLVLAVDTTQGTAANRLKLYVNGTQITSFSTATYPSQNYDTAFGLDNHFIQVAQNAYWQTSNTYNNGMDGNIAEVHILDGVAKAPSDFGETNSDTGQWVPKEYEGGSYGTNGFYGKFASGAIGTDSSGNSNTMTVSSNVGDVVTDTPTNNFATMNPIYVSGDTNTFSEGNLRIVMASTGGGLAVATIVPTAGKYYAEFKMRAGDPSYGYIGVTPVTTNSKAPAYMTFATNSIAYYGYNGQIIAYPNDTVLSSEEYYRVNDIIAVAIDYDNSTIKWYKNNSLQYTKTSAVLTDVTFAIGDTSGGAGQTMDINFGQKAFVYTPPSGYTTLSTANLPDPSIPLPEEQFNTVLYAGTGSAQTISGVGFQPDFLWIKCRSAATWHNLRDAVRGNNKEIFSNDTYQEVDAAGGARAMTFESDGFAWGSSSNSGDVNGSGRNYVSWNWKANGSGSTDTSGDIDAVVSANQAAGFSVITWTSNGSNDGTVPHGLGVVPDVVLYKNRTSAEAWYFLTTVIDGSQDYLILNDEAAKADLSGDYGPVTSSVFPNFGFVNGREVVAYCFASIPGFSKIGAYTGFNAADGPFVNLGFRPAWVMVKRTDGGNEWIILDVKRDIHNVTSHRLFPNLYDAESTSQSPMDILSNGFKLRTSAGIYNAAGTYFYMAFAESPFKTANAR